MSGVLYITLKEDKGGKEMNEVEKMTFELLKKKSLVEQPYDILKVIKICSINNQ